MTAKRSSTIVFFSTYPPRECGIATFTKDLLSYCVKFFDAHAKQSHGKAGVYAKKMHCKVAALNLTPLDTYIYPKEVAWEIAQNNRKDYVKLADIVNNDATITGVVIQHEYGIFGGAEGEHLLQFMRRCTKPMLVTLHTVLPSPTPKMKEVTQRIVSLASTIVVLTKSSKDIVEQIYVGATGKVSVVPHGIHPTVFSSPTAYKKKLELGRRTILSTFGLLSPGKGIEYVLRALPEVIKAYPSVLYLILGETHPVVRRRDGEKYRLSLSQLVIKLKLQKHVRFFDQYLTLPGLVEFLKATDIYIATSTNPNQAVSGTLSYALGTGRAVISTEFAQAREIVTPQIGRLVPIKNSPALTRALLDLLRDRRRLTSMSKVAYAQTRLMLWSHVAEEYMTLLHQTMIPPLNIDHLRHMTDEFGLFQFASLTTPNKQFGYTVDDNARAAVFCSWMIQDHRTKEIESLLRTYLSFINHCLQPDGSFTNYIDVHKSPTDQNLHENLENAHARALWALAEIIGNKKIDVSMRNKAEAMFFLALPKGLAFTHLRAKAFAIKAFVLMHELFPSTREKFLRYIATYADDLLSSLKQHSQKTWHWFEQELSYSNGLLPESLLLAGHMTKNEEYTKQALRSLQFLIEKTFSGQLYRPIGHRHWYRKDQKRSHYDQQPEDPAAMIFALAQAYEVTHDALYKNLAKNCYGWFLGNNTLKLSLYDAKSGGCHDGLHPDRVNLNEGAESLVSFLLSTVVIQRLYLDHVL